jgi:hypothetical protein
MGKGASVLIDRSKAAEFNLAGERLIQDLDE